MGVRAIQNPSEATCGNFQVNSEVKLQVHVEVGDDRAG